MEKKYWIKDLTKEQVVHVPTLEIAEKICCKLHELRLKWHSGTSYLEDNFWRINKEETCYNFTTGLQGSRSYYEKNDYEILSIDQILDFDEPFKLEVGKFYKTRDGKKVRIYSVENGGEYPIHGAINTGGTYWTNSSWQENGIFLESMSPNSEDIVGEWE